MLTGRGWWLLGVAVPALAWSVAMPRANLALALVCLTLLVWFAGQWVLFVLRVRLVLRGVRVVRDVRDERGAVNSLWAGRRFEVGVRVLLDSRIGLAYVAAADFVPYGAEAGGDSKAEGPLGRERPLEWSYSLRCPAPGRVRFEGVGLRLADLSGLFYHTAFVREELVFRVLPPFADAEGHSPTVKRHNLLPPPGVHRLRRPGSGSELLDLRDYLPGDPPKTIAWKVSARRGRLMTKEFESEVPVRCTLFVDVSDSVRVGPPASNALGRLVEIAAAVAQGAAGARDLAGLCLFDEEAVTVLRPARGPRHLAAVIQALADAAGRAAAAGQADLDALLPVAYSFAREVYPEMLRPAVNRVPAWLPWLFPQPSYVRQRPRWADRVYAWQRALLVGYAVAGLAVVVGALAGLGLLVRSLHLPGPLAVASFLFGLLGLALAFATLPARIFFPQRRRHYRWRKQMAALLSVRHGLGPGGLGWLLEDDGRLASDLRRFLGEHQVPYPGRLYDGRGRYVFQAPRKVGVLSRALLAAVARGHDNELYVLLADLLELDEHLGPLVRAVKVALARHHQVMVVCPWPAGIEPPGRSRRQAGRRAEVELVVREATAERFHRAYGRLRREFARLGVPLVCARGEDPVRLILQRLDRLRAPGRAWR